MTERGEESMLLAPVNPEAILALIPELSTERLLLRKFRLADLADVFAYIGDPEVTRYLLTDTQTREQTRAWLEQRLAEYGKSESMTWWPWAIVLRPENKVIGGLALRNLDLASRRIEIAYALVQRYWRQGIMTEAIRLLLDLCFARLELNRVEASVLAENAASCRMLEGLGFRCEGIMRQRDFIKGALRDMATYALLGKDWI